MKAKDVYKQELQSRVATLRKDIACSLLNIEEASKLGIEQSNEYIKTTKKSVRKMMKQLRKLKKPLDCLENTE